MRTTVDIDQTILAELKRLQREEGKSLGRLISDLLARALREPKTASVAAPPVRWISQAMGARVELADTEAVYAAMDQADQSVVRRNE
ncbi:MAG: antitoxin [Acidobacteria bacterium]|nr:antitoxin [Acidobacteriota bacterium]